jgi:hypothetical protein
MTSTARLTLLAMMLMATAPLAFTRQMHATRGVVKVMDQTALVLTRFQQRGDITLMLSSETHVAGVIRVGATVSVRYRDEGSRHMATAVTVEDPRQGSGIRDQSPD